MSEPIRSDEDISLSLAKERTVLANERTFAGWTRTGMSMIGLALGAHYVLGQSVPVWLAKLPAIGLVLLALFIYWSAWHKARKTFYRLRVHTKPSLDEHEITTTALGLALVSIAIGILIWVM